MERKKSENKTVSTFKQLQRRWFERHLQCPWVKGSFDKNFYDWKIIPVHQGKLLQKLQISPMS